MNDDDPTRTEATPSAPAGVTLWASAAWREQAVGWLDAQLAAAGIERTGEVEQPHLRPWSTVLRAPTTRGVYWLKAPGPGTVFEVRLYRLLAALVPESVLTPLALDETRGWLILPDGGATLGDSASGDAYVAALAGAMAAYGRLQRGLAPHADELVRLGVTDMRPAVMPARFDEAMAAVESQLARTGTVADRGLLERVALARGRFGEWCRELAGGPVAPSLDHNDLHGENVFAAQAGRPVRFYDWGDSVVAHPFASLLVPLGLLREQLGAGVHDARLERARAAYLEVFADLAPSAELARSAELACRVGKIARVLTWSRALGSLPPEEESSFARAPLRWLGAVLDPDAIVAGA